jgi:hypothetical protein
MGEYLNAIFPVLEEENEDGVIMEETDSDESVSDDDENTDPPSQPRARPNLRNLKWVSQLDKPIGKCGFTG